MVETHPRINGAKHGTFPMARRGLCSRILCLARPMAVENNVQSPAALLSEQTVGEYLIARGIFGKAGVINAQELGGGVSNIVLAAQQGALRVVVKQALERLRVPDEWRAPRERSITEGDALRLAAEVTPGSVPEVLDLDREACVLTIAAAPPDWTNWKERLLSGSADLQVAARLGDLLGTWHAETFGDRDVEATFGSSQAFDELRIDPYYRTVAKRRPELSDSIEGYVQRMQATRACLVHGDYSPKNVLVGVGLWVIDFEVAHYGDPAFDLAFMLSHLLLKRLHVPQASSDLEFCAEVFWGAYAGMARRHCPSVAYVLGHVGCLMVARVDGKSRVEYLTDAERVSARTIGSELLLDPPGDIGEATCSLRPVRGRPTTLELGRGDGMTSSLSRLHLGVAIAQVVAREILDSRGRPTVEVDVRLTDGAVGRASVPSGASTGSHEARELRDGDASRFGGFGVRRAVMNVSETITQAVVGRDPFDQPGLDAVLVEIDGTPDKSKLGANAMLGVSAAVARAAAASAGIPLWRHLAGDRTPVLPLPMVNILSGGLHSNGGLAFQDFLVVPVGATTYDEALETVYAVRAAAGDLLAERGLSILKADEGGFGPGLDRPEEALDVLVAAIVKAGRKPGDEVMLALDVAATHFFDGRHYRLPEERHLSRPRN